MIGIDDFAVVGIAAGFSTVVAAAGELLRKYLAKRLSKDLEVQIKTPSGETIRISVATTGDKADDAAAVARALHEAQGAVTESQPAAPTPRQQ